MNSEGTSFHLIRTRQVTSILNKAIVQQSQMLNTSFNDPDCFSFFS